MMNIEDVAKQLRTGDIVQHLRVLTEVETFMKRLADETVNAMNRSDSPVIIAEQIFGFVYCFRTKLEELFKTSTSEDLKTISASLLAQIGSNVGVDHLIHVIETGGRECYIAATTVFKMGIHKAVPALIHRLDSLDQRFYGREPEESAITSYLSALRNLGGTLPAHIRDRIREADVHPQRRKIWCRMIEAEPLTPSTPVDRRAKPQL